MKRSHNKNAPGQSLIEVVIALAVAVIIAVALVGLTVIALRNAQFAKTQNTATRLSQEGVEKTRSWRDNNWVDFSSRKGTTYMLDSSCQFLPSLSCTTTGASCAIAGNENHLVNGQFLRCVTLTDGGTDQVNVTVVTKWQDGSGDHESRTETFLSNQGVWAKQL